LQNPPAARSGSCLFMYNSQLFLWGGSANDNILYAVNGFSWETIPTSGVLPQPRQIFPSLISSSWLYIFPGHSYNSTGFILSCSALNFLTLEWYTLKCEEINKVYYSFSEFDSKLAMFGGLNKAGSSNDLVLASVSNLSISLSPLSPNVVIPSPRFRHSLKRCRDFLWLFGGVNLNT
jgi:hypothetical protein